jgi:hypothetical protein
VGDPTAVCDYCGVVWYRSELRRDASGLLVCPQDEGGDRVSADEYNATVMAQAQERVEQPDGARDYAVPDPPMPLHLGYELEVHLSGEAGVTTDEDGRLTELLDHKGRVFTAVDETRLGPLWDGQSINGRQAIGLFDSGGLEHTVGTPLRHSTHTIFMVVEPPEVDPGVERGLVRFWNLTEWPVALNYFYWDEGTGEHRLRHGTPTVNVDGGSPSTGQRVIAIDMAGGESGISYSGTRVALPIPGKQAPALLEFQYGDVGFGSFTFSNAPFGGVIGEILHFNPVMRDATVRAAMVDWLERRWGII